MGLSRSRVGAVLVAALLSVSLVACGGEEEPDAKSSETPSSSATPTTVPSPTKTTPPLSKFENKPQVKALRKVLQLQARAVNAGNISFADAGAVLTEDGKTVSRQMVREDVGLYYPGPVPFTPTRVDVSRATAHVYGCVMGNGFALTGKGGKVAGKREVTPGKFNMVMDNGQWKMDSAEPVAALNCSGVAVRKVSWSR